ncbi:MAG: hydrogenase maturation nickel metallochaperone HypA [Eggerthellaceae bacterium]|jgi:hydrogenase nickel incorporation protein HypA/HybF
MHEMSIMTSVVDAVLRYAAENDAKQVRSITLVVGELHDVVDSLMERCLQFLARGTVAEHAALELRKVPLRVQCTDCLLVYPADLKQRSTLVCPECNSTNFRIHNGNEFLIDSIEIV